MAPFTNYVDKQRGGGSEMMTLLIRNKKEGGLKSLYILSTRMFSFMNREETEKFGSI